MLGIIKNKLYNFYTNHSLFYRLKQLNVEVKHVQNKLSMIDDVWEIKDTKFWLPHYPIDFIARDIVSNNDYFEIDILKDLDNYVCDNSIILDIGANIGNHSLYWAIRRRAKKIYAFEPVTNTYDILRRNVMINKLGGVIEAHNIGLSDSDGKAEKKTYRRVNIGDTHLSKSNDGDIELRTLDSFNIDEKIDFVKIDVEDFECFVLKGAKQTLLRDMPLVFIESYPDYYNEMNDLMASYGYEQIKIYPHHNYLYRRHNFDEEKGNIR